MDEQDLHLKPGTLRTSLLERTAHARRCGAIQSIPTSLEVIEQNGLAFQVRITEALAKKEAEKAAPGNANPFLSYDPELFVASLSPTHVALLNKFNVVEHHLLIVTRMFEDQRSQLTQKDCEALLIALTEIDGLAFYNAGSVAGASQLHKHLQLIPFESAAPPLPIEPLLRFVQMDGATGTIPGLPFRHTYAPMDRDWTNPEKDSGASLHASYRSLLLAVGLPVEASPGSTATLPPYNLLVTRRWLLLVPRSQEFFEGISINALGFAGALLVKDAAQLAVLRKHGPMTALQRVTLPQTL
jgi:ATP adenylyltransferase